MGLLDEAIREHLELKRLRGADPGAVAREEREALAPMLPVEPAQAAEDEGSGEPALPVHGDLDGGGAVAGPIDLAEPEPEPEPEPVPAAYDELEGRPPSVDPEPVPAAPHGAAPGQPSLLGEETAELDMQAAMDELAGDGDGGGPREQAPGQERLSFE
ncbi:MAG TPA: hypothetical protein VGY13_06930 [Solirubrobacteraceae bacterium]|jgi:hypothetical protein|nr:hypothetical protein [Solirubrobacteraceae bacterium]